MKTRTALWVGVLIGSSAVIALGAASVAIMLVSHRLYYPSPQQRSAFLIAYNPGNAVAPFVDSKSGRQTGSSEGSGAGDHFVTHNAEFDEYFTTQKSNEMAVMAAVVRDLDRELQLNGVRVLSRRKGADNALHISYTIGPVLGSVVLGPLTQDSQVHRASNTLPAGYEDVTLRVALEEKWFPNGTPSHQDLAQIDR